MLGSALLAFVANVYLLSGMALLAGTSGLIFGSKWISRSIIFIAKAAGVPVFVIALFLVAFSTSIPELTVGITSALSGIPELSFGDIYGSNIFNLTFIAGSVLLIGRKIVHVEEQITKKEQLVIFTISSLPVAMMLTGSFSRLDGVILIGTFFTYLVWLIRNKRFEPPLDVVSIIKEKEIMTSAEQRGPLTEGTAVAGIRGIKKQLMVFAIGATFLVGGAQLVIYGAVNIAKEAHVPVFFIGIFLLSVGTSLPELSFGVRSGLGKRAELSLGDVIGSSAVNSALILGTVATLHPMNIAAVWRGVRFPAYCMMLVFALFFALSFPRRGLTKYSALGLLATYFLFLFVQIKIIGIAM